MPSIPKRLRLRRKNKYADYPNIPLNNPHGGYRKKLPSNLITTTKYSLLTFIPKNLFEQFRRMTNCYFLLIVIITFIPEISPLTPWTSVLPLSFVLGVTALKEAYEDIQRWKADNTVNNKKYQVMKTNGSVSKTRSKNLKAGDIIKIKCDQYLPADIVPLSTSLPDGVCFIETAQLDGETYLKSFKAPPATNKLSDEEILKLNGHIEVEAPGHDLYKWTGTLCLDSGDSILDEDNLLLRGAKLRNTEWVVGMVVYTGKLTKLSLNQQLPPSKFSTVERRLNKCVIAIFTFKLFCITVVAIASGFFHASGPGNAFYLQFESTYWFQAIKDFFSYFALLSFMIPMSLMVTLELVKVIQGKFMEWDRFLAGDPDNVEETGMKTKTTNLNDELALVRYIFSDKTGTLTENCMEFLKVSINGVVYDNAGKGELGEAVNGAGGDIIAEFLTNLAVCHGAVVEEKEGEYEYKSQSPDEEALCEGAKNNGYIFNDRKQEEITVNINGEDKTFQLLHEIKFSSARARMSVVVRHPDGSIRVYSKGADSKMKPRLAGHVDPELLKTTWDNMDGFSKEGLRTLILGYKVLSEEEYQAWDEQMTNAQKDMNPETRSKAIENAADAIEKDFELLGSTAIEDRLQRDVPSTIHNLLRANIKFWMITGDKQETAENIATSCKLLKNNTKKIRVIADTTEKCGDILEAECNNYVGKKELEHPIAVIIDGSTLAFALNEHKQRFLELTSICASVVCCRVSPLQKALIVKLMKEHTQEVCLSIGDGANDVGMIQEAHIGIGIFGKEGTQAARSSDYAIQEFRHLRRLLTVHGRYSYIRNSGLIQYSIYKNAAAFLVQFWFAFYCGYSATTIYDDWIVTFFNIFFTSVPPFFFAIFEKDISESIIEEYPETYRFVQRGELFTYSTLFYWLLSAIWHSLVFFFAGAILLSGEPFVYSGRTYGLRIMGNMVSTFAIMTVILKMATFCNLWNIFIHAGIWGSLFVYVMIFLVESLFYSLFPLQYFMFFLVVSNPNFWMMFLLVVIICLTPDVFGQYVKRQFYPDDWQILQEAEHFKNVDKLKEDIRAVEAAKAKRRGGDEEP